MRDNNPNWYDPKDLIKTEDMAPDSDAVLTADVIKGKGRKIFPRFHNRNFSRII